MVPDGLDRVAKMLAQRFGNWQDTLAAAALWAHHPCITRHSPVWASVACQATTNTVVRLGGCFCEDVARLVAALAEKTGERLGVSPQPAGAHAGPQLGRRGQKTHPILPQHFLYFLPLPQGQRSFGPGWRAAGSCLYGEGDWGG